MVHEHGGGGGGSADRRRGLNMKRNAPPTKRRLRLLVSGSIVQQRCPPTRMEHRANYLWTGGVADMSTATVQAQRPRLFDPVETAVQKHGANPVQAV